MESKQATLEQAAQVLSIISASGAKREDVQEVFSSGLLSDLFRAARRNRLTIRDFDRRDFRVVAGLYETAVVHVWPDSSSIRLIQQAMENLHLDQECMGFSASDTDPESYRETVIIELIPDEFVNDVIENLSVHGLKNGIRKLGYRFATTAEFLSFASGNLGMPLGKRGIVGGSVESSDGFASCLEFCWRPHDGPALHVPRIRLHRLMEQRDPTWWVAGVRV